VTRLTSFADFVFIVFIICGIKENIVKTAALEPIIVQNIYYY